MFGSASSPQLDPLLRAVSRSFFLTLKVTPRAVRRQLGTGYLFCRAADTIADTRLLEPKERIHQLEVFRRQFSQDGQPNLKELRNIARDVRGPADVPEERELLQRLDECFSNYLGFAPADRALIRHLVNTLTQGMEMDLKAFPAEDGGHVVALPGDKELDQYCYYVAGCVGEFWTDLQCAHLEPLQYWDKERFREIGVRFGKALQMTNILRDIDADLKKGRSYLPQSRLAAYGIDIDELRRAEDRSALRPVVHDLLRKTLDHYRAGWTYTLAIPRRLLTMRLACIWPLWIGLRTLALIAEADDPAGEGVVLKVSRDEVYSLMRRSAMRIFSNASLERGYQELEAEVVKHLQSGRVADPEVVPAAHSPLPAGK